MVLDDLYNEIADAIREKESSGVRADIVLGFECSYTICKISGSYPIVVHSSKGATVTATQGDVSVSSTIDSSGQTVLWVPRAGIWSIAATKGSYTSSSTEIEIVGLCALNIDGPEKLDTTLELSVPRAFSDNGEGATTVGDYALFGGGNVNSDYSSTIDVYTF